MCRICLNLLTPVRRLNVFSHLQKVPVKNGDLLQFYSVFF